MKKIFQQERLKNTQNGQRLLQAEETAVNLADVRGLELQVCGN